MARKIIVQQKPDNCGILLKSTLCKLHLAPLKDYNRASTLLRSGQQKIRAICIHQSEQEHLTPIIRSFIPLLICATIAKNFGLIPGFLV
jgi:hypothetical protein